MLDPEVETRPWTEQLALDDASYRAQVAYLFSHSAFYREKLAAAGVASAAAAGGLADIGRLPLTEKDELKATCTSEQPDRRPSLRGAVARSSGSTRPAARRARPATSR